jgi:hypothetical protein
MSTLQLAADDAEGRSSLQPPWAGGPLFLTTADVATIMAADPRSVRRGIESGVIPSVRVSAATIRVPAWPFWTDVVGLAPPREQAAEASPETAA